ncbi:MAG: BREX-1 system phosphatase PglZ type A, partial [bacterium]
MKRIHDSLRQVLGRHRLVFWYDSAGDWSKEFEAFATEGVEKVRVENNEFGVKVRILRHPNRNTRFLLYFPSPRPLDSDNWLLDLLLQGHEYKADRASLALQDTGLSYDFHHVVEQHLAFFNAPKNIEALRGLLDKDDDAEALRLKIMAVLTGTAPDLDTLLLHFLNAAAEATLFDPLRERLGPAELVEDFWKGVAAVFGYKAEEPTLLDFAVSLFRGANPLETAAPLLPHGRVFLQRWKDSQSHAAAFRHWAVCLEADLHVEDRLESLIDISSILDADEFPVFEKKIIHSLCRSFEGGAAKEAILPVIQRRRRSFWYPVHEDGYRALEQAVDLRELIARAELSVNTLDEGLSRYTQTWWRIDMAYRQFWFYLRRYAQTALMERIADWVEKTYVNNFLLPLTDRWSDRIRELTKWSSGVLPSQMGFFERYVRPFLDRGQKVFVVISDALRYEAACEFAASLRNEDRWTCEVEATLGVLPSYTQLGMAALLPGGALEVEGATGNVILNGRSTAGTQNRSEILKAAANGRSAALQAEEFLELNTKTEGRALMRDNDVVYIYHNSIDRVGDSSSTEAQTFDAVERALGELLRILKKIANINASNMLLTSDHGFLFQQNEVAEGDMATLPAATEWT